jgi:hypothetical protein
MNVTILCSTMEKIYSSKTLVTICTHIRHHTVKPRDWIWCTPETVLNISRTNTLGRLVLIRQPAVTTSGPTRSKILTPVLLMIQVFWDVTPCRWASSFRHFEGSQCLHPHLHEVPEGKGTMMIWNVGKQSTTDTASHLGRLVSKSTTNTHSNLAFRPLCIHGLRRILRINGVPPKPY